MYLVNLCRIPLCLCRFSFLRPLHPSSPRNPEIVPVHKLLRHFVTNSAALTHSLTSKKLVLTKSPTRPYKKRHTYIRVCIFVYTCGNIVDIGMFY